MRFIHLSDLHLGKRLNEMPLWEDQKYICNQIVKTVQEQNPDAVLIAGDVYDKSVPSPQAVELFDDLLVRLAQQKVPVLFIGGNHDSVQRLAFGGRIMEKGGVIPSPVFDGTVKSVTLSDEYGPIHFYLLPFIKPLAIKEIYGWEQTPGITQAMQKIIEKMNINTNERNVLLAHQFVAGAQICDSEEYGIGGTDGVDKDIFTSFDYVALGHLHAAQNVGENIRYCGSPLKYSFSEVHHKKSITVVEMREKGNIRIDTVPLLSLHELRKLRGSYEELTAKSYYENTTLPKDYLQITLTDEQEPLQVLDKLRVIYENVLQLQFDNRRTRAQEQPASAVDFKNQSPLTLFSDFYLRQNGDRLNEEQQKALVKKIEQIWGDET